MPRRILAAWVAGCLAAVAADARAQPAEKPHVYALVSAVGSEINYVRQKESVGTHLQPFTREVLRVPDVTVDAWVLRGLDRAISAEDPASQRVYLRLNPDEVKGILPYERGDVLAGKAVTALESLPDRKNWYRIILVTPSFLNAERAGMGSKLHGIGVYVQPLGRNLGGVDAEIGQEAETVSATGKKARSYRYVAPYFYVRCWIIDAQTMKVLEVNDRHDFQRLYDPDSGTIDVEKQFAPEQLAGLVETFVERAAARAFNEGEVIVKEPRVIPAPGAR